MNVRRLAALLPCLFLLGCPHDSAVPLADFSEVALDDRLVGSWRCVAPDAEDPNLLSLSRVSPTELRAAVKGDDDDPSRFRLRSAMAGSIPLVNVEALDTDDKKFWSLARFTLASPRTLRIELARREPFEEAATASARDVVDRSLKRGDLFELFCECTRSGRDEP